MNNTIIDLSVRNSWGRSIILYRIGFDDILYYIQTLDVQSETLFIYFCKDVR